MMLLLKSNIKLNDHFGDVNNKNITIITNYGIYKKMISKSCYLLFVVNEIYKNKLYQTDIL